MVTGTSLVSMMLVEEIEELRNLLTMCLDESSLPPATRTFSPFNPLFGVVPSWLGGRVIGTRFRGDSVAVVDVLVVVVVDAVVVVLLLIHGGSGASVVVVVVETNYKLKNVNSCTNFA